MPARSIAHFFCFTSADRGAHDSNPPPRSGVGNKQPAHKTRLAGFFECLWFHSIPYHSITYDPTRLLLRAVGRREEPADALHLVEAALDDLALVSRREK
jgi:hypothetical protein